MDSTSSTQEENPLILRFRATERRIHWAIAGPFTVCWMTAVVLILFYNRTPQRPLRDVFSWTHRIAGALLLVLPLLVIVHDRKDWHIHLRNIREAWLWTLRDIRWLFLMGLSQINKRIKLPEQGKFNAAEKMNFMSVMTTWPLFIVTGVLIWLPGAALVAWWTHLVLAALVTPLMLGHIFMATVNPDTKVGLGGMFHGWVDRYWAKHHYRSWYREHHEHSERFESALMVIEPEEEEIVVEAAVVEPAVEPEPVGQKS